MEKFKNFNERATKALGGTTKGLWTTKKDDDNSVSALRESSTNATSAAERPPVAIHLAPPTDATKSRRPSISRGEREERASGERRSSRGENSISAPGEIPSARPELRSESSESRSKRRSSGPADDMIMEQLSSMSQELANTKMEKQEMEMELKKLRAEVEKLSAERDTALVKAQQQEKELTNMKQAVVFESVEKGQLEVRKLRTDNVQLEARVAELTETNANLEATLAQRTIDLEESQEEEAKLTAAMAGFQELLQKEAKVSAELLAAKDSLNNVAHNEDLKLSAQREVYDRVLAEKEESHKAEIGTLEAEIAKLEETSGSFKRKAEGLARDLKKRMEKDAKDDDLRTENIRLKEEVQRKSKSLSDAMQELLQGGGEEGPGLSRQLQKDLDDARRQLGTLHEKEMTVEHLKSANVILSQRIMDLEAQFKTLGLTPAGGNRSLVTSSSTAMRGDRKSIALSTTSSIPLTTAPSSAPSTPKAKHSDEDEELP